MASGLIAGRPLEAPMKAAPPVAEFSPVDVRLRDGRCVTLRAVRPQDKDELQAALKRLSAESRYARFMSALRELSPQMLERVTNPDESRELQLVAVMREGEQEKIIGSAAMLPERGVRTASLRSPLLTNGRG